MFENLPSLRGFQPKFYCGGPMRFHLPLLYDLVASEKPKLVVTLGWSDGEGFFTLCQAASEEGVRASGSAKARFRWTGPAGGPVADSGDHKRGLFGRRR